MTYIALWQSIEAMAAKIETFALPGERVLLLFEPGLSFVVCFFACLRVSVIAVPAYPPMPSNTQRGIDIITAVVEDASITHIITSEMVNRLKYWKGKWPTVLKNGSKISYHHWPKPAASTHYDAPNRSFPQAADIAFLQYTSGSTGAPKGVIIGHDNFLYNVAQFYYWLNVDQSNDFKPFDQTVITTSWLPIYHDLGLTAALAGTLFNGGTVHLMSPFDFITDPLVWLDVSSATRSTHCVGPNFAFGLMTRKWDASRASTWNLSSMKHLLNCAEPIVLSTVHDFLQLMERDCPSFDYHRAYGFAYGMAESVVAVGTSVYPSSVITSVSRPDLVASIPNCARFCGILIIDVSGDGEFRVVVQGQEGEIFIQSPSIARGYWNQVKLTEDTFHNVINGHDGYWLRTGDIGYIENNHLFICGREKDIIIVRGKNIWPQDLENAVVASHAAVRPGSVAAFPVSKGKDCTETFAIVAEIRESFLKQHGSSTHSLTNDVIPAVSMAVFAQCGCRADEIVLVKERTIPKTTSGKIRRKESKRMWMEHQLKVIITCQNKAAANATSELAADDALQHGYELQWVTETISAIRAEVAITPEMIAALSQAEEECSQVLSKFNISLPKESLAAQGLDSLHAAELSSVVNHVFAKRSIFHTVDLSAIQDWSGVELVSMLCGVVQVTICERQRQMEYCSPLPSREREVIDKEIIMDEQKLLASYSSIQRAVYECIAISGLIISLLLAIAPAAAFYHFAIDLSSPMGAWIIGSKYDTPLWLTIGVVLILYVPIFFMSFTAVWILQKWLLWGRYKAEFIPIYSGKYYRWWYLDRLTSIWELLVFTFIADSLLVNVCYILCGAFDLSLYASISTPIRCPGLVMIGEYSVIEGFVYPQEVLPHGVSMSPIHIGSDVSIKPQSIVHRGCKLDDHVILDPLSVLPAYHTCSSSGNGRRWSGNICHKAADEEQVTALPPAAHSKVEWMVEQVSRVIVLLSLPWGSIAGLVLVDRFWYLIFPAQPLSSRIASFWFYAWSFYGAGLTWSIWTFLIKWLYFGKVKEGPYNPGLLERIMRWALSRYHSLATKLFWGHFVASSLPIWYWLLGAKVHITSTIVVLICHPADLDLVEIKADARISSNVLFRPYNSQEKVRKQITVGRACEVGFRCILDSGVVIQDDSKATAYVHVKSNTIIESGYVMSNSERHPQHVQSQAVYTRPDSENSQLVIPNHVGWYAFNVVSDTSMILFTWLPLWFAFFVYRSINAAAAAAGSAAGSSSQAVLDDIFWVALYVSSVAGITTCLLAIAMLYRIWDLLRAKYTSRWAKLSVVLFYRWILQFRFIAVDIISAFVRGSILVNLLHNLAGSTVALSATLHQFSLIDMCLLHVGEFVAVNEHSVLHGHSLWKNEMVFTTTTCESFSSMQPWGYLYAGRVMKRGGRVGSNFPLLSDIGEYEHRQGNKSEQIIISLGGIEVPCDEKV